MENDQQDIIIFDVGANIGSFAEQFSGDPRNKIYLFEPTPFLLNNYLYPKQSERYLVVPVAVSDYDGEAELNIAGTYDWGCSSLYKFDQDATANWTDREDFVYTDKVNVLVRRMDSFMNSNKIPYVDYLKIDTQGSDLKVLQSFGEYIKVVREGQVEASNQNHLYKDVDNTVDSVITFLKSNNFTIDKIYANDPQQNEVNIMFSNPRKDYYISFNDE
jgi:FkbM family methyltransferase